MNLEKLKQDAREKCNKEFGRITSNTPNVSLAGEMQDFVDEIVTSTYLQAVEDCLQECNESDHLDDAKTYINQILQSLKQTKK